MAKQLVSGTEIVKKLQKQSLTLRQEQTNLIGDYLCKLAIIEGRNRVVDEVLVAIYMEALSGIETRKLEKGLRTYLQEGTNWPWPGTLRQYIEEEV